MPKKASFTQQVKEELSLIENRPIHQVRALLSAYIRINGHFQISGKSSSIVLQTENAKVARYIYSLIKESFKCDIHFDYVKNKKLNKTTSYKTIISTEVDKILEELNVSFLEGKISKDIVYDDETIASYLCGAFLASGSVNSPHNSNYHLEICLNDENYAKWMSHLFARYKNSDFEPKVTKRRESFVLYLKKSDKIADFLIMIGAVDSCMEFENIRVDRDFMNTANRLSNFDMANMERTVKVAKEQVKWIKLIDTKLGVKNIANPKVRQVCLYRLENESLSMQDIAERLSVEFEKPISKSAVARLFVKIRNLYEKLSV